MQGLLRKSGILCKTLYLIKVVGAVSALCAGAALYSQQSNNLCTLHAAPGSKPSRLFAWGAGLQGQLGVGTELIAQALPREVTGIKDTPLTFITASNDLSAAIDDKGRIYTWGRTKGMMAQEQKGFTANIMVPTPLAFEEAEKEFFTHVACGRTHMAAVTKDGKLYTWGSNDMGKLGLPTKRQDPKNIREYHPTNYADKATFGQVTGLIETKKIVQVACGFHHTLCLTEDGTLYAFGGGKQGALGVGDWNNHGSPVQVQGLQKVKKICCGSEFSMALTADGKIFAWGRNNYGQLGVTGRQQNKENNPHEIILPKEVRVKDISCGEEHAALLTKEGHVYTWGYGHDGQLGQNSKTHLAAPKKIEDFKETAKKVVCGGGHTAILTEQGELFLFGRGRDGQLGKGDAIESVAASRYAPIKVDYFSNEKMKVSDVALGTNHTLALVD